MDNKDCWISPLSFLKMDIHNDIAIIIIGFLSDIYGGMVGWKIINREWDVVVRKKFEDGVSHTYSFSKFLFSKTYFLITALNLEDDGDCIIEFFHSPLSADFRKFIIQNIDKLNPRYEDGDIVELHWITGIEL